jgi:hypothetical protein
VAAKVIAVTSVAVTPATLDLKVGGTATLAATVAPEDATDKTVTWSSNATEIAEVNASTGEVTAKALGEATITATAGGQTATCAVTVSATEVTSVTVTPATLDLKVDETATLTATVAPEDATDKTVTWSSSASTIAEVNVSTGEVTAKAIGEATITATAGGQTATCAVTVSAPWISLLPEGRYRSTLLATNGENNQHGYWRVYKYIMRMSNDPQYENKYVVWGTVKWSAEWGGRYGLGWMYNRLSLNNEADMTYDLEPMVAGADWPSRTFTYTDRIQQLTTNNKYDPATKTLTLYYKNDPEGGNPVDVLTYVGDEEVYGPDYTKWTWPFPGEDDNVLQNWGQARSSGYKWWLPTD